jgi:hypothetical protein
VAAHFLGKKNPGKTGAESKKQGFTVLKNAAIVFQQGMPNKAVIGPSQNRLSKQWLIDFCELGCKQSRQRNLLSVARITDPPDAENFQPPKI